MAATIYEMQETRSLAQTSGKVTGSRKFAVWDDGTQIIEPATIRALFGGGSLPDVGDAFPGETDVYAVSYNITHIPDSRGVWEVSFQYENTEPGTVQPQEPGYVEFSVDFSSEFRDTYRANPSIGSAPLGQPNNNDIGGSPIDSAGEAVSGLIDFATITIGETVLASTIQSRLFTIATLTGRRNNGVFQGFAAGTLVYQGASANRIAVDKYSVTHRFAYDERFHMQQMPERDQNREVVCIRDNANILRAKTVRWVQPFPSLANFNLISENF
jgi:hypothetical protein